MGPSTLIIFLGIELYLEQLQLWLSPEKLKKLKGLVLIGGKNDAKKFFLKAAVFGRSLEPRM